MQSRNEGAEGLLLFVRATYLYYLSTMISYLSSLWLTPSCRSLTMTQQSMLMFNTQGCSELSETHLTMDTYGNRAPVSDCTACSAVLF